MGYVQVVRVIPYSAVQLFAYEVYKVTFLIDYLDYLEAVGRVLGGFLSRRLLK